MTSLDKEFLEPGATLQYIPPPALEAQTRGEIDIQIATAKRYPRSIKAFINQAREVALLDEETAAACFYALPRDGKTVVGPSARLAEIVASCWGHMRIEGRPIADDGRFLTARGMAWDLEKNVAIAFETKRKITGRSGQRFSDDMIMTTSNAATSIAIRNAVFKVVPSAFWRPIFEECRAAAVGKAETLANTRAKVLAHFGKLGVTPERIFGLLGVKGIEDVSLEHVESLRGLATAIKEGDTSIDEAFPLPTQAAPADVGKSTLDKLADAMPTPAAKAAPPPTDATEATRATARRAQETAHEVPRAHTRREREPGEEG